MSLRILITCLLVNKWKLWREVTCWSPLGVKQLTDPSFSFICQIIVWDTAGMERTRSLTSNYYHNSEAVILVYAIDDMYSLTLLRNWILDVNKDAGKALKFLVGNKIDLAEEGSQVDEELARRFCENNGITKLYKVSAKTGKGVREMFDDIAKLLLANKESTTRGENTFTLKREDMNKQAKKENGCSCWQSVATEIKKLSYCFC